MQIAKMIWIDSFKNIQWMLKVKSVGYDVRDIIDYIVSKFKIICIRGRKDLLYKLIVKKFPKIL